MEVLAIVTLEGANDPCILSMPPSQNGGGGGCCCKKVAGEAYLVFEELTSV